ncbi:MAG: phosphatase PAP2 family protein [Coprothermobacterota bacterium]|nr:phosphatase PAP2 family protein [Coprothermobacterota bacterium]
MNLDYWLFFKFYNLSGHSQTVDSLIVFLGEYFFYLILAVFTLWAYRDYKRGGFIFLKPYGLAVFSSLVARFGVAELIRLFCYRPRPFMAFALPHLLTDSSYSFPSGHTIFIFALATSTYLFNKKLGCFLYFSGLLIGLARISGGVHYPSDILGGMILGTLTSLIIFYLSKRKK